MKAFEALLSSSNNPVASYGSKINRQFEISEVQDLKAGEAKTSDGECNFDFENNKAS